MKGCRCRCCCCCCDHLSDAQLAARLHSALRCRSMRLANSQRHRHTSKLSKSFKSSSRIYVRSCLFSCAGVCVSVWVRVCECSCLKRNESESFAARVLSELKRRCRRVCVYCDRTHTSLSSPQSPQSQCCCCCCLELIKGL